MTLHPSRRAPRSLRVKRQSPKIISWLPLIFAVIAVLCLVPLPVRAERPTVYKHVIGIDLGTTYSSVGIMKENEKVEIIRNERGNRITPSWVSFTETGRLVGEEAKEAFQTHPRSTVFDAKRLIGRRMDDPTLLEDKKHWPFSVTQNKAGNPTIAVEFNGAKKEFLPEEISAMVLSKMKGIAEAHLGEKVVHAVVTVPAYFNNAQREATKNAGKIAGLNVLRTINEPTAAALAFGLDRKSLSGKEIKALVYDLGGGTFDVSLLSIEDGVFEVLATGGDTHLGGEDFDNRVIDHLTGLYQRRTGNDIRGNDRLMSALKRDVEQSKRALSISQSTTIEIQDPTTSTEFSETLTRTTFEELNSDLFKRTMSTVSDVLKQANTQKEQVDEIVLVGGSTRIPKVRQILKEYFGKEPCEGVDPDEAVAFGAAVQGGVLSGLRADMTLIDIVPMSLGIETSGGIFTKIINRGTVIPTHSKQAFSTVEDNQQIVKIRVLQGDRALSKDNEVLGDFELTGISKMPKGTPKIEVTFEVNADGILTVSAIEPEGGSKQKVKINNPKGKVHWSELQRLEEQQTEFAEQEEALRKKIEAFERLAGLVDDINMLRSDMPEAWEHLDPASQKTLRDASVWTARRTTMTTPTMAEVDVQKMISDLEMAADKLAGWRDRLPRSEKKDGRWDSGHIEL